MDNTKTGALIAERRRALGLTQEALADRLHVTNKAVSKWERGLSFPGVDLLVPLAETLGVTVMDLLAGEVVEPPQAAETAEAVAVGALTDAQRTRRRAWLAVDLMGMFLAAVLIIAVLTSYAPAIFQRGNPIPYLTAAARLSDTQTCVQVKDGVYISRRGECPALFDLVRDKWDVEFVEQAGSGYVFARGQTRLVVSSEVYWGRWTVWTIPTYTVEG